MYFFHQAQEVERWLSKWAIATAYAQASHEVLRAYMLGRAYPDTPRLARLRALIDEGGRRISVELGENEPDPLAESQASSDALNP